jgi:putative transposase
MGQFTRRIVGFGIQRGAVDGASLCRMFNDAISAQGTPCYISTDHDPLFEFHRWKANLRILEIDELKTVPYTPTYHPFVERLVGTIRREFLDHVFFWNTVDLTRKLCEFRTYYNEERVHSSLGANTPCELTTGDIGKAADFDNVRWISHCHDLVQLPVAA